MILCLHWSRQGGQGAQAPPPMAGQKRFFLLKYRDFQVNFEAQNALKLTYEHL